MKNGQVVCLIIFLMINITGCGFYSTEKTPVVSVSTKITQRTSLSFNLNIVNNSHDVEMISEYISDQPKGKLNLKWERAIDHCKHRFLIKAQSVNVGFLVEYTYMIGETVEGKKPVTGLRLHLNSKDGSDLPIPKYAITDDNCIGSSYSAFLGPSDGRRVYGQINTSEIGGGNCWNLEDGSENWERSYEVNGTYKGYFIAGNSLFHYQDSNYNYSNDNHISRLDPSTGKVIWKLSISDDYVHTIVGDYILVMPKDKNNNLESNTDVLYRVDTKNGETKSLVLDGIIKSTSSITYINNIIYIILESGIVYQVDPIKFNIITKNDIKTILPTFLVGSTIMLDHYGRYLVVNVVVGDYYSCYFYDTSNQVHLVTSFEISTETQFYSGFNIIKKDGNKISCVDLFSNESIWWIEDSKVKDLALLAVDKNGILFFDKKGNLYCYH